MQTAIFSKALLDLTLLNVHLHKNDIWVSAMYKGATLKGFLYDYNELDPKDINEVLSRVIPKSLNQLSQFEQLFENKVTYLRGGDKENYFFISDEEYFQSFIINQRNQIS